MKSIGQENGFDGLSLEVKEFRLGKLETTADEILQELEVKLEAYLDVGKYVGNEAEAKKELAGLRRLQKQANDKKIEIKKAWNEPLEAFLATMKKIDGLFDEVESGIDGVVKALEGKNKEFKRGILENAYKAAHFILVPFERLLEPQWLNASFDINKAVAALNEKIKNVYKNIELLEKSAGEYASDAKTEYLRTLDYQGAVMYALELHETKKRLAAEKAEREGRQQKEALSAQEHELYNDIKRIPADIAAEELVAQAMDAPVKKAREIFFDVRFYVKDAEQKCLLKQFLTDNGIRYANLKGGSV